MLFASDLDNTLIFSYKKLPYGHCVEVKDGKNLSFMTKETFTLLQQVNKRCCFVPITTRSLAQYQRIHLLENQVPHYALCANGAILLVDGVIDGQWRQETSDLVREMEADLQKAVDILNKDQFLTMPASIVDESFAYCKSKDTQKSIAGLKNALDTNNFYIDTNGEKLYVLPKSLTKGLALKRLQKRLGAEKILAAGDSKFDLSMLLYADVAIIPKASVLYHDLKNHQRLLMSPVADEKFAEFILQTVIVECQDSQ